MKQRGFSLVELVVVIATIGLLMTGVAAAHSIVSQVKLKKITYESEYYLTAISKFKSKYGYIPGDYPNASEVWGDYENNKGDVSGAKSGNGDGSLITYYDEKFSFWRHLSLSGFVEEEYSGASNTLSFYAGVNLPKSDIDDAVWSAHSNNSNKTILFENIAISALQQERGQPEEYLLTPKEARSIDIKLDDGDPQGEGRIWADNGFNEDYKLNGGCYSHTIPKQYNTSYKNIRCILRFRI